MVIALTLTAFGRQGWEAVGALRFRLGGRVRPLLDGTHDSSAVDARAVNERPGWVGWLRWLKARGLGAEALLMFTWRRQNDMTSGEETSVAYLRQTTPGVLCYYAPCPHPSTVALFNARNGAVANYCRRHGRQALREYTRSLQADQATRDIA